MNKIVVIASTLSYDFFDILSFHRAAQHYLNVTDFTVIVKEYNYDTSKFLLNGIRVVERSDKDFGLLESIKFAHKLKDVFNTTHVFNLDNSLGSVSFAKSLRPKYCYGVKSQVTNLVYNKEFANPSLVEMLEYAIDGEVERGTFFEEEASQDSENFFKVSNPEPFLFIAVDNLNDLSTTVILNLLKVVEDKRVIFWSPKVSESSKKILNFKRGIVDASEVSDDKLYRYISAAFGVLTDRLDIARLSNYFLKENIYFSEWASPPNPLMVNKTVSVTSEGDSFMLDYSNGQKEKKNDSDEVISIILSLFKD